ncbi:MAG: PEGA domain-containing protein [Methanocorpusculum sp.]|nr:PEGA domain-containing protein [Candidatus Methanocorpusculum equi]
MKKTTIILTLIAAAVALGGFAGAAAADPPLGAPYEVPVQITPQEASIVNVSGGGTPSQEGMGQWIIRFAAGSSGAPTSVSFDVYCTGYVTESVTRSLSGNFIADDNVWRYQTPIEVDLAPIQQNGYLSVSSSPSSASVYIDGSYEGTTPLNEALSPGTHSVRVTKNGYSSYSTSVRIYEGQTNSINVSLSPVTSTGYLSVSSTPKYADVYVDGSYMGQTPLTISFDTGSNTVTFKKSGYLT